MHLIIDHHLLYKKKGAEVLTPTQMMELHTTFGNFINEGGRITVLCPENTAPAISESTLVTQFADQSNKLALGTFNENSLKFLENMDPPERDTTFVTANQTRAKHALKYLESRHIGGDSNEDTVSGLKDTMTDMVEWKKIQPTLEIALKRLAN